MRKGLFGFNRFNRVPVKLSNVTKQGFLRALKSPNAQRLIWEVGRDTPWKVEHTEAYTLHLQVYVITLFLLQLGNGGGTANMKQ